MRKVLLHALKIAGSGILAFCLLCVFAAFYYNPAAHIPSPSGATDYIRDPDTFYAYMTEGYSFGRTDQNGFNNPGAMAANKRSPDILFMGSSHIEAMYVPQRENAPYVLQEMLGQEGKTVYNIAMSAHPLAKCLRNLENALETYRPREYVIIESMSPILSAREAEVLVNGTQSVLVSYGEGGLLYLLQKLPYIKLAYEQYRNVLDGRPSNEPASALTQVDEALYYAQLSEVMRSTGETAARYGCTPIILFHPRLYLNPDGSAETRYSGEDLALMKEICEKNGILLVDMSQSFLDGYDLEHILPNGFTNTQIGTGHLNRHGHRMVAEALYPIVR